MTEKQKEMPKWLKQRYSILWESFKEDTFTMDKAVEILKSKSKARKEDVAVYISELRKLGYLIAKSNETDYRKRIYTLQPIKDIVTELRSMDKTELGRDEIESILKRAADLIRTRVDYKFILVLLFLKRISDKWQQKYDEEFRKALKDGLKESEAKKEAEDSAYHDFDMPQEYLWDNIRKDVSKLPEKFSMALKKLAELNPEFKDTLDNVDFVQFAQNRENYEILRQLVELFSEKKLHDVSPDILGDSYEWILKHFAPQKAKEGEVYTAREVIRLLVEILEPKPKENVYDPASASNGMLIVSYNYVSEKYGRKEAEKLFLSGQEVNPKTLTLGKMNMYIHDIKNAQVASGDTLLYPKFKGKDGIKQFDVVIANPPWNQDGYDEEVLKKGDFWQKRFSYGFTPRQSADWAWIQHMLASAKNTTGRVGVVIDNGCLFRGGKEMAIRKKILEEDLIECLILLPEKLFYNTAAPGAIMILNKNKKSERKNKVLIINASQEFEQHPEVRKLNILSDKNIKNIVDVYNGYKNIKGFSRAVPIEEIKSNDFTLNVTMYVFPEEEHEDIDITKEWQELKTLEKELQKTEIKIEGYLKELK
ncbi:MAG: class I SAM-dependent DNA methyltransferase [Elusimicrobiota bacterium]